jgi:hypothetical protein
MLVTNQYETPEKRDGCVPGERKELWKGSGTPRPLAVAGLLALKLKKSVS